MTDATPGRAHRAQVKLMAARILCAAGVPALARARCKLRIEWDAETKAPESKPEPKSIPAAA